MPGLMAFVASASEWPLYVHNQDGGKTYAIRINFLGHVAFPRFMGFFIIEL